MKRTNKSFTKSGELTDSALKAGHAQVSNTGVRLFYRNGVYIVAAWQEGNRTDDGYFSIKDARRAYKDKERDLRSCEDL